MIALVHGPDAAIARREVARLVAERDPDGAATSHLDARETALPAIAAAAGSAGFFGAGRVVVVHDLMTRAGRGKGGAADADDGEPAAGALDLKPLFAAVPPENLLILVDPALLAIPAAATVQILVTDYWEYRSRSEARLDGEAGARRPEPELGPA